KSIREHEPNMEMFEFIFESLCALDEEQKLNPDFHLLFLVHFARHLGFSPHGNFSDECCFFEMSEGVFISQQSNINIMSRKESSLLNDLMDATLFENSSLRISRAERKQMMRNLLKYYQLHLENFSLKSPEILEEILD
ncbi:MAG: DNA repair protein RecO C-terminal domain-containing protein, partial [Bacteroidota bacterium]